MNGPHLDDERLSAHLDGTQPDGTDPAAADHLAECGSCRGRLEALREVAGLVGAAVPPAPPGAMDAAVAAALSVDSVGSVDAPPGGAPVVPISTAVRRRRTQVGLAAAAAVVTVVLGLNTLVGDNGPGDDRDTAALMDGSGESAAGPDLGDQSDPRALADRLRTAVEGESVAGESAPDESAASGMAPTQDDAGAESATSGGGSAAGSATEVAPASRQTLTAKTTSRPGGPCTATATSEYRSDPAGLVFQGTLRWEGTPAVVLVYRIDGATGPLDHRVLVLARDDCRLLVAQSI